MTTAKKKVPTKRAATAPKKSAVRKSPTKKAAAPAKKAAKSNFFRNMLNDARGQMDGVVDSVMLKAKQVAAKEKLMRKKAELATKAEIDKARHLAQQAEKWMSARIKSDTKKINRLEKKLTKQLRDVERKLVAEARSAERKAKRQGRALKKRFESETSKAFGKTPVKKKVAAAKKKATAPKRKAATARTKSSAQR